MPLKKSWWTLIWPQAVFLPTLVERIQTEKIDKYFREKWKPKMALWLWYINELLTI